MAAERMETTKEWEEAEERHLALVKDSGEELIQVLRMHGLPSRSRLIACDLRPKDKEHQRKKVLRTFFSWRSKQPMQSEYVQTK